MSDKTTDDELTAPAEKAVRMMRWFMRSEHAPVIDTVESNETRAMLDNIFPPTSVKNTKPIISKHQVTIIPSKEHTHQLSANELGDVCKVTYHVQMLLDNKTHSCKVCNESMANLFIKFIDNDCPLYPKYRYSPKQQHLTAISTKLLRMYGLDHKWRDGFEINFMNNDNEDQKMVKDARDKFADINNHDNYDTLTTFACRFHRIMQLYSLTSSLKMFSDAILLLFEKSDPRLFEHFIDVVIPVIKAKNHPDLWKNQYYGISPVAKNFYEKSLRQCFLRVAREYAPKKVSA